MLYIAAILGAWTACCWFSASFEEPFLNLPIFALPWFVPFLGFVVVAIAGTWLKIRRGNGEKGTATTAKKVSAPHSKSILAAIILINLLLHLPSAFLFMGANDSDSALSGLAGYNIAAKGERPMFRYGLHYIGSTLSHVAAGVQLFTGPQPAVQRLIHIAMYAGFILIMWSLGRRILGEQAALAAAAIAAVPPFSVMFNLRYPEFVEILFWGMLSLWILVNALDSQRFTAKRLFLYGLVCGVLFYAHPQGLVFISTGLLTLFLADKLFWTHVKMLLIPAGFMLGSIVTFIDSYYYDWVIFRVFFSSPVRTGSFLDGMIQGAGETFRLLPYYLGLKGDAGYSAPDLIVILVAAVFLAVVILAIYANRSTILKACSALRCNPAPLLPILLFFVTMLIFILSDRSTPPAPFRYLTPLWTAIPLLLAVPISLAKSKLTRIAAWVPVGIALLTIGISLVSYYGHVVKEEETWREWTKLYADQNIETFFGDFWVAYQTTFISSEKVVGSSAYPLDYTPYDESHFEVMAASELPAYIFSPRYDPEAADKEAWFTDMLAHLGILYKTSEITLGTVFYDFSERITPAQFQSLRLSNGALISDESIERIENTDLYLVTFEVTNSALSQWFADGARGHIELVIYNDLHELIRRQPLMFDVEPGESIKWRALLSLEELAPTGHAFVDIRINDIIIQRGKHPRIIVLEDSSPSVPIESMYKKLPENIQDFSLANGWGAVATPTNGKHQVWSGANQAEFIFFSDDTDRRILQLTIRPLDHELLQGTQSVDIYLNGNILVESLPVDERQTLSFDSGGLVRQGMNHLRFNVSVTEPTYRSTRLQNAPVFRFRPRGILLMDIKH